MMTLRGTFGIYDKFDDSPSPLSEEEIPENLTRSLIGLEPTERTPRPFNWEQLWRAPATEPEPEHKTPDITDTQDSFTTVPEITKNLNDL